MLPDAISPTGFIFLFPLAGLLLGAAVQDVRTLTIANGWPLAIIVLFVIGYPLGATDGALWSHGLHFAIALAIGMALFAMGWFGGGDAKLYAAIALWFDLGHALHLFVAVVLSGLVLAIAHLGVRLVRRGGGARRLLKDSKLAYGIAIAVGALIALPTTLA